MGAGCTTLPWNGGSDHSGIPTTGGGTSGPATGTNQGYQNCNLTDVPKRSLDTEPHEYPVTPTNWTDRGLKSFVTDFEQAIVHNDFHDGTEDEFYVTFDDVSVTSRKNGSVVHVSTVHMVENRNGTPGDQWYSVTYVLNASGVRRSVDAREASPSPGDGDYVVTCTS